MGMRIKKTAYVRCRAGVADCKYGCIGCGMCAEACRLDAIRAMKGSYAKVDAAKCVGCGLCVKACPQNIIELIDPDDHIQPACSSRDNGKTSRDVCFDSCIACGICERNCPADAVHVIDNVAVIDHDKCICCGMCAVKCPRGVIRDLHGIMTE